MRNKTIDIQQRTFEFACRVIRLYKAITKKDRANEIIARQLVRAGTSIGANLEEAAGAQSRADFLSKCNIALKEARECYYWLRLLVQTEVIPKKSAELLIQESNELVSILTCIVKNTRNSSAANKS